MRLRPLAAEAPSSISFFALSQAPPPEVIAIARKRPVTIVPIRRPPSISGLMIPTRSERDGISAGSIIRLIADLVTMSTARRVVRPRGALHDPGHLAELAAHLLDDLAAGAADCRHREGGEEERHHPADEEAGDHLRVVEVEGRAQPLLVEAARVLVEEDSAARPAEPIA